MAHEAADRQPFARVGQESIIRSFESRLEAFVSEKEGSDRLTLTALEALDRLWSPTNRAELDEHLAFFDAELRPLLELNYHRAFDRDGDFVDHGWWLDLPFLILFTIEFYGRWFWAVRMRRSGMLSLS